MKLQTDETIKTDVLIIGGGAAGLRAAIEARKRNIEVVLVSESPVGFRNNTAIAAGGFTASGIRKGSGDSPEVHLTDTLKAGCYINDRTLVHATTSKVTQEAYALMKFGVTLRQKDGEIIVRQGSGHTYPRNIAVEALKGINLSRPMRHYATRVGAKFIEGVLLTRLLQRDGRVVGALGLNHRGQLEIINARTTILATGGAGQIYHRNSNALGITGDGYSLAYDVGTTLRDMEFVQFYPTTWGKNGIRLCPYERFLPSGAAIRNSLGENILLKYGINDYTRVNRDELTRLITREILEGRAIDGHVIFDFTTISDENMTELYHSGLMHKGEYPAKLPVAPSAHFFMGGVKVNEYCETEIDGLFAAGEVCGGVHGANRLIGNAISEVLVFGAIAGERAATLATELDLAPCSQTEISTEIERLTELGAGNGKGDYTQIEQSLKQTMWDKVGVIRSRKNLEEALHEILTLKEHLNTVSIREFHELIHTIKTGNMLTVSEMVCRAALKRTESRGAHYRADYPESNDRSWLKNIEISNQNGSMLIETAPVQNK